MKKVIEDLIAFGRLEEYATLLNEIGDGVCATKLKTKEKKMLLEVIVSYKNKLEGKKTLSLNENLLPKRMRLNNFNIDQEVKKLIEIREKIKKM